MYITNKSVILSLYTHFLHRRSRVLCHNLLWSPIFRSHSTCSAQHGFHPWFELVLLVPSCYRQTVHHSPTSNQKLLFLGLTSMHKSCKNYVTIHIVFSFVPRWYYTGREESQSIYWLLLHLLANQSLIWQIINHLCWLINHLLGKLISVI